MTDCHDYYRLYNVITLVNLNSFWLIETHFCPNKIEFRVQNLNSLIVARNSPHQCQQYRKSTLLFKYILNVQGKSTMLLKYTFILDDYSEYLSSISQSYTFRDGTCRSLKIEEIDQLSKKVV